MPVEVILPKVDMDMTHGTLAVWHAAEGDTVAKGAPLFDIETDKAAMEVEAPASGTLTAITAQPGDRIAVGSVVALILADGEQAGVQRSAPQPDLAQPDLALPDLARTAPVEVILPKVDMDMTHGTLAVWHVAEGDTVAKGAPLFDIETDKAAMEVEAPASGTLRHVAAKPGDRVPVGAVVALIYPPGAVGSVGEPAPARRSATPNAVLADPVPAPDPAAAAVPTMAQTTTSLSADQSGDQSGKPSADPSVESSGIRATPAARAAARQAGVALADVTGTGPLGRIQREDVRARVQIPAPDAALNGPAVWRHQSGPLHISHRKGAGTPLVLIHGFTADSKSWAPLEKALGPARSLIRIDLPGHGRSPRRAVAGFSDLGRMITEAFDAATTDLGPVHLLGHSLGGALALALADIRPRRVASLALISPAGLGPEIDAAALNGIVRATRAESLAPWLRRLTATPDGISDDYARAAMALRTDPDLRACQADMAAALFPDGVQAFDLRPAAARLQTQTSLIWGRQDHILPHRHALAADADFALHLLARAGHVAHIECPDRVARILARHLAAAEAPA